MLFTANDYEPVTGFPPYRYCCFCLFQALGARSTGIFRLKACGHIFHRECLGSEEGPDTQIPCVMCFNYRVPADARPVVRPCFELRRLREAHHGGLINLGAPEVVDPQRLSARVARFVAPEGEVPPRVPSLPAVEAPATATATTPFQSATDPCPVCMYPMRDTSVLLQCNHRFHASCLLGQRKCPYCRSEAGFPTGPALNHAVYAESAGLREEVQKLTAEASSPVDTIDESVLRTHSLASVATSRSMCSLQ
jgi:hypothetical protein